MMEIDQILDELDNSRERLLVAIEDLPDEALLAPGVLGEWAIADLLVNLTVWEAEVVTGIMRLDQGKKPEALQLAMDKPDVFDAQCYAENRGRDLDRVFDDWQQVRVQLEEWLETLPVRALTNPKRYKWLNGRSLWQLVQDVLIAREKRFLPYAQLFAQRWRLDPSSILPAEETEYDQSDS
ncbi:MAG: ClbS/DfsB family four-helix bundle protein [Ardenticatenaceae bacterium]|nr:ClbS/DfsB family four-helix bundle protein [Anaerolineales bacterium]MCB8923206.1 ClbS/DfsB family four-helix bundle protein [Ardenticatenaceae bacterium]MCB9004849.1 ClbS/DfsB family four-helix bundle protein [Ardenticatenaceae bacterium]